MGSCNNKEVSLNIKESPKKQVSLAKSLKTKKNNKKVNSILSVSTSRFAKFSEIEDNYEIVKVLGKGSFGTVELVVDKHVSSHQFAVKKIEKQSLDDLGIKGVIDEIKIIRQLDHPNIVKYFELYETEKYIHIVMEYIPGMSLYDLMKSRDLSEEEVSKIVRIILKTLKFMNSKDIVHRDLKPHNILFTDENTLDSMKIIDFGLSTFKKNVDRSRVGSPYYMSPEAIDGVYYYKSDIWSLGVITFLLLIKTYPFKGENNKEIFKLIKENNYRRDLLDESTISEEAKDFIRNCLSIDDRISCTRALSHPFLTIHNQPNKVNSEFVDILIMNVINFSKLNVFIKEVFYYLSKLMTTNGQLEEIRSIFASLDENNNGVITKTDLIKIIEQFGEKLTDVP